MAWGWLKGLGKVVGGLTGIGGGGGIDYGKLADVISGGGAALGAYGQGQATNRDARFSGQMDMEQLLMQRDRDYFNQMIAREQEGRASGTDAWRKLMAAQRTLSPGPRPQLSPYSVAPRQITDAERQGADAMTAEVMARLTGGNQIAMPTQRPMSVDPRLLEPGKLESTAGWLSPVLGAIGAGWKREQPVPILSGRPAAPMSAYLQQAPRLRG